MIGEGFAEECSERVGMQHKLRMANPVAYLGTTGDIGWDRVLFGEISLGRCSALNC